MSIFLIYVIISETAGSTLQNTLDIRPYNTIQFYFTILLLY